MYSPTDICTFIVYINIYAYIWEINFIVNIFDEEYINVFSSTPTSHEILYISF